MKLSTLHTFAGCALLLAGCGEQDADFQEADAAGAGLRIRQVRHVDRSALDAQASDTRYMARLVQASPDPFIKINYADPVQYRFVLNRLAMSGKTRDNSPDLFEQLEQARAAALSRTAKENADDEMPEGYTHIIANILADGSDHKHISTDAYMTVRGGAPYAYLDTLALDSDGNLVGESMLTEQYDEGTDVTIRTAGDILADDTCVTVDSLAISDVDGVLESSYKTVQGCINQPGDLTEPRDQDLPGVPLDGVITVCLNRSWLYDAYDCEYTMDDTGGHILFPFKGSIDFDGPVASIVKAFGQLSLPSNGGSCKPSLDFFSAVQIDPNNPNRVIWDISSADFGSNCFAHQQHVNINIGVEVTIDNNGTIFPGYGTISSQGTQLENQPGDLKFATSCFAAGTQIRTADGDTRAIETVQQDEQILASRDGLVLSAVDMSIGVEDIPMVRLEDSFGHALLLTEGHPVITTMTGVTRAGDLRLGDEVYTENGVAILTRVDRELYDGNVYNLKLGTDAERRYIGQDETTMFANGFLVGDGRIQADIEFDGVDAGHRRLTTARRWLRDARLAAGRAGR